MRLGNDCLNSLIELKINGLLLAAMEVGFTLDDTFPIDIARINTMLVPNYMNQYITFYAFTFCNIFAIIVSTMAT